MKRITGIVVLAACCMAWSALVSSTGAEEPKIQPDKALPLHAVIRIDATGAVSPSTLTAQPGTTVVWINESSRPIEVQFEGKQVTVACKSPVHFIIDEHGSFLSNRIPARAVASLCFIEKGEFMYKARTIETPADEWHTARARVKEYEGKIIIQKTP
jgi:plastocyanin